MKRFTSSLILLTALILAACNPPQASPVVTPETPVPQASHTPSPTATPTPPPEKALFSGDSGNPLLTESALALLLEQAALAGLSVETVQSLQADALTPEVKLVVALTPPPDLPALLAAAPQAQFVVVSPAPLEPSANLSVVRLQAEHQAFIAGFVSVLLSTDWRAAGLIPAETPNLQEAFANGGRYFCGNCSPGWPLGATFPQVGGAPAPADGPAWQAAAAFLFDNGKVEVFYLSAEATRPEVLAYLNGLDQFGTTIRLVGAQPRPEGLESQWGATVGFDTLAALGQTLPEALAGRSAGSLSVPVSLSEVNPNLLTPGRQQLVEQIMQEVAAGLISPLNVPTEP